MATLSQSGASQLLRASDESIFLPERLNAFAAVDISSLFSPGVLTRCEHRDNWTDELTPHEKRQIGDVCESRYAEFAAGRTQARQLIAALTGVSEELPIGDFRQPVWPESVIGSISHSSLYCAVVVAPEHALTGIGLDVEPYEALDADVAQVVLTELEQAKIRELDHMLQQTGRAAMGARAHKLIFSIKEAIYKCCYPSVRAFIDFKQCDVSLDVDTCSYRAVVCCENRFSQSVRMKITGRWLIEADHIFTSAEYS